MLPTILYLVIFSTQGRMRSEMEQFQDLDRIRREFDTTQVTNRRLICCYIVFVLIFAESILCFVHSAYSHTIVTLFCCALLPLFSPHNKTPIIFASYLEQAAGAEAGLHEAPRYHAPTGIIRLFSAVALTSVVSHPLCPTGRSCVPVITIS